MSSRFATKASKDIYIYGRALISLLTARELSLSSFDRIRLVAGNEVAERKKERTVPRFLLFFDSTRLEFFRLDRRREDRGETSSGGRKDPWLGRAILRAFLWRNSINLLKYLYRAVQTILNDISRANLFIIVILSLIVVVNKEISSPAVSRKKCGDIKGRS